MILYEIHNCAPNYHLPPNEERVLIDEDVDETYKASFDVVDNIARERVRAILAADGHVDDYDDIIMRIGGECKYGPCYKGHRINVSYSGRYQVGGDRYKTIDVVVTHKHV